MAARRVASNGTSVLSLEGDYTAERARELLYRLESLAREARVRTVTLDLARTDRLDSVAAAALRHGERSLERGGKALVLRNVSPAHRAVLDAAEEPPEEPREPPPDPVLERLGARTEGWARAARELGALVKASLSGRGRGRLRMTIDDLLDQITRIGVDAIGIVALLGALMGVILAFQAAFQLRKFGAAPFMGEVVGLAMVREFGVIVTAIILTGRTGAAITAEIATMQVNEEIDALRVMGIDPVRYLVVPRVAALTLTLPPLTLIATCVGIACALPMAGTVDLPWRMVFRRIADALAFSDFALAFVKSLLFAWIIGFTGCFLGLRTRGGAKSVGENTTRCVVLCILFIVVIDAAVTTVWTSHGG